MSFYLPYTEAILEPDSFFIYIAHFQSADTNHVGACNNLRF